MPTAHRPTALPSAIAIAFTAASLGTAADDLTAQARAAAQRGVALIQKVNAQWKTPCVSCHHQVLGALALESARAHGIAVDESAAQAAHTRDFKLLLDLDAAIRVEQLIDPAMSEGSMLWGAGAAGLRPTLVTAAYARHIAGNQQPGGNWLLFDSRPPTSHTEITATAIAARAVALYHPHPQPHVARARQWLSGATPRDTEGATFRLLGLHWTAGSPGAIAAAAAHLAGLQRPDGGWAQVAVSKESDAYSTAEALYALRAAKAWQADDHRFARGVRWLLDHQAAADGSWHVKSRLDTKAPISPPYFESGFPYGHDQFVSMAATGWAVRALAEALPETPQPPAPLPLPAFDESRLAWARTAMFGSPAEAAKIDPNAATPGGTTALMLAANDPEKVAVLLGRGARPKAVTPAGYDALMMAALFHGNARSARLLLDAGVPAAPARKIRFDASPLALAIMANDPDLVELLLSRGANPNHGMRLLGGPDPGSPVTLAVGFDNTRIIGILAKAGARIEHADALGMTALSWAAISQRTRAVRTLLDLGADPKHKDTFGLIPLQHTAAVIDAPGDTAALLQPR